MSATERRSLFAGLAALAAAVVVLELGLTRVAAVVLGPEAAFAVAPIALAAGALGALAAAALASDRARPAVAVLAEVAAALSVAAIMVTLHVSDSKVAAPVAEVAALAGRSRGEALLLAVCAALPFAFGGAATGGALRAVGGWLGPAAFALAGGAAGGTVVGVLAVRAGAPRAVLLAAVVFGVASAALTAASRARAASEPAPPHDPDHLPSATDLSLAATAVVGSLVLLAGDVGAPWLKLKAARVGIPDKIEVHRWSELGLLTADRPQGGVSSLRVDGVRRSVAVDGRGNPPAEPEDLAFAFAPERGPTLVVDPVGGGRTARAALKAGQEELACVVGGVALSEELTEGALKAFGAPVYGDARVRTRIGDGRAEVRGAAGDLHLLVVSAAQSTEVPLIVWPRAGGAIAIADASLSTREAIADDLARLAPGGAIVVRTGADPERLAVSILGALRAGGASEPVAHLFACGGKEASAVLARKTPLSPTEVRALRAHCQKAKLLELFAPDQPRSDLARRLAGERLPAAASAAAPSTIGRPAPPAATAPPAPLRPLGPSDVATDDRPFAAAAAPTLGAIASHPGERLPFVVGVAGLLAFLVAARFARPRGGAPNHRPAGAGALVAAGLLGVGAAGLEALLGRWLTAALGHPVFALLFVVPAVSAGLAVGALLVDEDAGPPAHARLASHLAVAGSVLLLAGGLSLGPLARALSGAPMPARVLAALIVIAVASLPIGAMLPLLLGQAARARPGGAAAAFGLHLLGQTVAIGLGSLLVVHVGFLGLAALAAAAFGAIAPLAGGSSEPDQRRAATPAPGD